MMFLACFIKTLCQFYLVLVNLGPLTSRCQDPSSSRDFTTTVLSSHLF